MAVKRSAGVLLYRRVAWFALSAAREPLVSGQRVFLDRLGARLCS